MTAVLDRIQVQPLHACFVAEITGVDLTRHVPDARLEAIWQAFNDRHVLVLHDQALDDDVQLAFGRRFGAHIGSKSPRGRAW